MLRFWSAWLRRVALGGLTIATLACLAPPAASVARPTGSCAQAPTAEAIDHNTTGVYVLWVPADPMPPEWTIERSTDGVNWTTIATVAAPTISCTQMKYVDDGLQPDTLYYYRVGGSTPIPVTTLPPPLTIAPYADAANGVSAYPEEQCNNLGSCEQWGGVIDGPFAGSFHTVGDPVYCGFAGCWRYNVTPQYTYPNGHTARLQIIVPEGYVIDDAFNNGEYDCGTTDNCNIGDSSWLTGQSLLGDNNGLPLLALCSGYPINPTPENLAEIASAYAQIIIRKPSDPSTAWIYWVRTGGETPACATTDSATGTTASYKWGQLWAANDNVRVYHHGRLIKSANLGRIGFGHHKWSFTHRHGWYTVRVCGKRRRHGATDVQACIHRRYHFR
jgi:hypothetical protein